MDLSTFLQKYPLYKKMEVSIENFNIEKFIGGTYNSYCQKDKSMQTFELEIDLRSTYWKEPDDGENLIFRDINDKNHIESWQLFIGKCNFCKNFTQQYLIRFSSNGEIAKDVWELNPKFFVQKIGQFPSFNIQPDQSIIKFFSDDDLDYYKKGLMNLSSSYGIGAFAYFRRIIETQILEVCNKIAETENDVNREKIKTVLKNYSTNHQMSNLIDFIFPFLPDSLKSLGANPLRLLYEELSVGLHSLSDDECFKRAMKIDSVLKYIIKTLNIEKEERKVVLEAIRGLTKK